MTGKPMTKITEFQKVANGKGWTFSEIAARWGLSERQLSRIAGKPKQRDLDALKGLDTKQAKTEGK
jgi:DNA-binding Xre family transcriptional regulator